MSIDKLKVPFSYEQAVRYENREYWNAAMMEKMKSLKQQ